VCREGREAVGPPAGVAKPIRGFSREDAKARRKRTFSKHEPQNTCETRTAEYRISNTEVGKSKHEPQNIEYRTPNTEMGKGEDEPQNVEFRTPNTEVEKHIAKHEPQNIEYRMSNTEHRNGEVHDCTS
jgi:hypothetical protein